MCFIEIDICLAPLIPVLGKTIPDVVKNKKHGLCFQVAVQVTDIVSNETGLCIYICLIIKILGRTINVHIHSDDQLVLHILVNVLGFLLHTFEECSQCRHIRRIKCCKHIGFCISLTNAAVNKGFFLCIKRVLAVHTAYERGQQLALVCNDVNLLIFKKSEIKIKGIDMIL